ncbi:MAG: 1-acyl-sn-glycerol-3-phosphate acyltransferase [Oscillospiraceae bacterium]|nr:1-acyl-sn-glycerol-3-phosphate acyltransferase [Oscillospiraceae bacterium]
MSPEYRRYRRFYAVCWFLLGLFFKFDLRGRENVPRGAAMVCANHSSNLDPFILPFAFGRDEHPHMLGKAEIFKIPLAGKFFKGIGMFSVDRGISDTTAVRTILAYLKNGEKVVIFPEGHRVSESESVAAKSGALRLADKTGVPIVPVYIPRKKRIFSRISIVIGEPYFIDPEKEKLSAEDFTRAAAELMARIEALRP